jgi:hypothetical protein
VDETERVRIGEVMSHGDCSSKTEIGNNSKLDNSKGMNSKFKIRKIEKYHGFELGTWGELRNPIMTPTPTESGSE